MKVFLILAIALLPALYGWSQKKVPLDNPSFEDMPQHSRAPIGWLSCGFEEESPVDIQPGFWRVDLNAHHGLTYIGMVVRASGTWEGVSQKMTSPLKPGVLYSLDAYLAKSPLFLSPVSIENFKDSINFDHPVILRLWGDTAPCAFRELLAQTPPVDHDNWKKYRLHFIPAKAWTHITLEAYFEPHTDKPYNGNILVDNLSDIIPHDLNEADEETLEWALARFSSNLFLADNSGVPAAALVVMLLDMEQAIQEMGFAGFWGEMGKEDLLAGAHNLQAAGAAAHATILEEWTKMLDDGNTPIEELEKLWNGIERYTPLSSIRRKLIARYREDIIKWLETQFKR